MSSNQDPAISPETAAPGVKQQVREFYDQVGWQKTTGELYQNARYEDLRPVSAEYIHRCHLRVKGRLPAKGRFLLDAGSGPVQYAEYLTYSQDHTYRVCADISIVALIEARKRLGERGLYVVADVANLPFRPDGFDGAVSLHTLHHLPLDDQFRAYGEIYRVLAPGTSAAVVNGWTDAPLMRATNGLVRLAETVGGWIARLRGRPVPKKKPEKRKASDEGVGTFTRKLNADLLRRELAGKMQLEISIWRSVSPRWLRALVHAPTGGRFWLRLLYALEERFPTWFGEKGQYPLVVIRK
jgi:ubiquinone/menaquinone biosynthesis C-methylase UbiE